MNEEYLLVPHSWRRALSLARIALAVACLAAEVSSGEPERLLVRLLLILFLLYSVTAASWRILERVRYAGLSLMLDSAFFLIAATIETEYSVWLAGVFYGYLMCSALLAHPWREVAVIALVMPLLFALVRPDEVARTLPVLGMAGMLGLVAARNRQLLIDRLIATSKKAVHYRDEAQKARDAERERIARDFHDGPQQSFISLQMRLEVLRRLLERDPEKAKAELAELQEITRRQVAEIRAFVRAMRPSETEGMSLAAAAARLGRLFERDTGVSTAVRAGDVDVGDSRLREELLKILREALHNVQKHSGASSVRISLSQADGAVEMTVSDDGRGFPFAGRFTLEELNELKMGPASICRRVRELGGELAVDSRPGEGATLWMRFPS